jgi:protein gp37
MSDNSAIEWTEATWNVVTGCTRISDGCDHCYIERTMPFRTQHRRFDAPGVGGTTGVKRHSERLHLPLRWRNPRRVFVNSLSDLFHDQVPDEYIAEVFAVMAMARQHTFQLLTKRHARMRSLLNQPSFAADVYVRCAQRGATSLPEPWWPLPNLWLGVSVENQQWAGIRIPALLDTPAAVRWLSCEPLIGLVDLDPYIGPLVLRKGDSGRCGTQWTEYGDLIDWVVAGGESGPGARPMHPDWARTLRDQCVAAGVPYFHKQNGAWIETDRENATHLLKVDGTLVAREDATMDHPYGLSSGRDQDLVDRGHPGWVRVRRTTKKAAGRILDGRTWDEYPSVVGAVA